MMMTVIPLWSTGLITAEEKGRKRRVHKALEVAVIMTTITNDNDLQSTKLKDKEK